MRNVVFILAIAALFIGTTGTVAQDSPGITFPYTPVAEDCQVTPRTVDEILSLTGAGPAADGVDGESVASPRAEDPIGTMPAQEQASAAVRELADCIAAGDMTRVFALFSDGYLERLQQRSGAQLDDDLLLNAVWAIQGQFLLGDQDWAMTLAGYLEASRTASPVPVVGGIEGRIEAIPAVWELGADRVAVVATMQGLACFLQCDYAFVFAQDPDSGRYLIDEAVEIFDLAEVPSG